VEKERAERERVDERRGKVEDALRDTFCLSLSLSLSLSFLSLSYVLGEPVNKVVAHARADDLLRGRE
jgi:hypothetical protein